MRQILTSFIDSYRKAAGKTTNRENESFPFRAADNHYHFRHFALPLGQDKSDRASIPAVSSHPDWDPYHSLWALVWEKQRNSSPAHCSEWSPRRCVLLPHSHYSFNTQSSLKILLWVFCPLQVAKTLLLMASFLLYPLTSILPSVLHKKPPSTELTRQRRCASSSSFHPVQ